jgi:hypothetical protein
MLNRRGNSFVVLGCTGLNYDERESRKDQRMAHTGAGIWLRILDRPVAR